MQACSSTQSAPHWPRIVQRAVRASMATPWGPLPAQIAARAGTKVGLEVHRVQIALRATRSDWKERRIARLARLEPSAAKLIHLRLLAKNCQHPGRKWLHQFKRRQSMPDQIAALAHVLSSAGSRRGHLLCAQDGMVTGQSARTAPSWKLPPASAQLLVGVCAQRLSSEPTRVTSSEGFSRVMDLAQAFSTCGFGRKAMT